MIVIESAPLDPNARTPAQTRAFAKPVITIGRSPDADFRLDSDTISRLAIRIVVNGDAITLEDDSEDGSTINGIHGWGRRPIREGDAIHIGPCRVVVRRTG